MERRKTFLVAPLDWGLGHATRCMPIINRLLAANCRVLIASSGEAYSLLKREFPQLQHFLLPAYHPVYPKGNAMVYNMAMQLPKFIKTIVTEHKIVNEIVKNENVDVVISDNRYGCYSSRAKSIFITHQVNILMPKAWRWMEGMLNRFNYNQLQKFDACWIPADEENLIPALLQNSEKLNTRYIGNLSRFEKTETKKKYDITAIVSGPDPQRRNLSVHLKGQLERKRLHTFLVKGRVTGEQTIKESNGFSEANYMNSTQLNKLILQSKLVICRSGYSSVMDLQKLGAHAVFIPTPGQTEQEYIASELMKRRIAFSMPQNEFNIEKALKESENYTGFKNFELQEDLLGKAIDTIL